MEQYHPRGLPGHFSPKRIAMYPPFGNTYMSEISDIYMSEISDYEQTYIV